MNDEAKNQSDLDRTVEISPAEMAILTELLRLRLGENADQDVSPRL
jgi:hypothetical protein